MLRETKNILTLAIPLIIGQLGQMFIGVADTLMIGKLGVLDLAALTFTNALFFMPFIFGIGALTAVAIRTSSSVGEENPVAASSNGSAGLALSVILGVSFFLLALINFFFLGFYQQPEEVIQHCGSFYLIIMLSLIPGLMGIALKNHSDALDKPWPGFWISMAGVALNIFLNWLLIFGNWGFPEWGLMGAGMATLIARVAIVIAMIVWFKQAKSIAKWVPAKWFAIPDFGEIKKIFKLGFPAGLQCFCEIAAFSVSGLMMGMFGATAMASHQIALQLSGMSFMIPLGLSMALTVRVGEVHGAKDQVRLLKIIKVGWLLSLGISVTACISFLLFGPELVGLFLKPDEVENATAVLSLAANILIVTGVFQIVDAIQVTSAGMLRGLHDTKFAAIVGVISYWGVGIPLSYLLAKFTDLGPQGIWWGLAAGLGLAAVLLAVRLYKISHTGEMARAARSL